MDLRSVCTRSLVKHFQMQIILSNLVYDLENKYDTPPPYHIVSFEIMICEQARICFYIFCCVCLFVQEVLSVQTSVCPKSIKSFLYITLLYEMSQDFLNILQLKT